MLLGARVAHADDVDREVGAVPGTFGDPLQALELSPSFTLVPIDDVPAGLAIRDADPSRVKLFVDGFEVPALLVGGRSIVAAGISSMRRFDDGMDLGYGGATGGGIEIDTEIIPGPSVMLQLTPMDAAVTEGITHSGFGGTAVGGMSVAFFVPRRGHDLQLDTSTHPLDLQFRNDWALSAHSWISATAIGSEFGDTTFTRIAVAAHYHDGDWRGLAAVSSLQDNAHQTLDTRADVARAVKRVGGLETLTLHAGVNTSVIDVYGGATQFDGGAWAALAAGLPGHIVAYGGARLEMFDTQLALSPRGTIAALFGHIGVGLTASAYRQPQVDRDATPERATEVVGIVQRRWPHQRISVTGYYIDRSRILVEQSPTSIGIASGVGTATGLELRESYFSDHWTAYFAAAISRATRADRITAPDHPADLDIPLRVDALVAWHDRGWRIGARGQLRSGLPYTPVTGSIYDGDTDTYSALYGKVNSERAPVRRQLDVRVDRQLSRRLHAYVDLAIDGGVLGYTYTDDFAEQLAVRAPPVIPWVGVSGQL